MFCSLNLVRISSLLVSVVILTCSVKCERWKDSHTNKFVETNHHSNGSDAPRSYQTLTASGDHLNGVYELRADRFYCDEISLLEFVLMKKRFEALDFIKNQDGLDSLYLVQTRTLDNLRHFEFPKDWRDKREVSSFGAMIYEYARRVIEREEYITCEILSSLLSIRSNELSTFDAFSFVDKPYTLQVNDKKCQNEFGNITYLGQIFEETQRLSRDNLEKFRKSYDSFLECIHSAYLTLTDFNSRYSFLMSIREVETKLINLLNKGELGLRSKFVLLSQIINQMIKKVD